MNDKIYEMQMKLNQTRKNLSDEPIAYTKNISATVDQPAK